MTFSDPLTVPKLVAVLVLYSFLPLTFITYLLTRRRRRVIEVNRILCLLNIDPAYRKAYEVEKPGYYFGAFMYVSVVTCAGLALLFLAGQIGLTEFPSVPLEVADSPQRGAKSSESGAPSYYQSGDKSAQSGAKSAEGGDQPSESGGKTSQGGDPSSRRGGVEFPHKGSRLVFGMAFFGAYLWGLQYLFRRYSLNDLLPSVYYGMSVRMILAATVAVVIYNAGKALAGDGDSNDGITDNIWPALAFVLGMFPQRGLRWLTERLPLFSGETDSSVRKMPLEMIEGMEAHDVMRLEEQGIDSCYDLAAADFIPLILKTPYSARQLIDWILQAKLCIYVGDAVKDLRRHGIRIILDLEDLDEKKINELVAGTAVTEAAIRQAQTSVAANDEIKRLRAAGQLLGKFWHGEPSKA